VGETIRKTFKYQLKPTPAQEQSLGTVLHLHRCDNLSQEMMPYVDKRVQVCHALAMKLSQYAKQQGISYRTALRWFRAGTIKGYQAPTGTIIVMEGEAAPVRLEKVAIYARVSSPEHRANLERQAGRLADYCAARGYQVAQVVKEAASGVNDSRPQLLALLKDTSVTRIVVEHRDRLTRFGFHYLEALLQAQGRTIEVVNLAENDTEDLIADLVAIVYSFTARLYGQRRAKRKTERIAAELQGEEENDATR
jgi:putative resolvase